MSPTDDMGDLPTAMSTSQDIAMTADYLALRHAIVERAAAAPERAARAVNTELVLLYWSIGRAVLTEQKRHAWATTSFACSSRISAPGATSAAASRAATPSTCASSRRYGPTSK